MENKTNSGPSHVTGSHGDFHHTTQEMHIQGEAAEKLSDIVKQAQEVIDELKRTGEYDILNSKFLAIENTVKEMTPSQTTGDNARACTHPSLIGYTQYTTLPDSIRAIQKIIRAERAYTKNEKGELLRDVCDRFLANTTKVQFLEDPYGDACIYFPSLDIVQRLEYLRPGNMVQKSLDGGLQVIKPHYRIGFEPRHPHLLAFPVVKTSSAFIYKDTIDKTPLEFIEALKSDGYTKGYMRKTLKYQRLISHYLIDEMGFPQYDEMFSNDEKSLIQIYMYTTGCVAGEWLNSSLTESEEGDKRGKIDGKSIHERVALGMEKNRLGLIVLSYHDNLSVIPLIKDIMKPLSTEEKLKRLKMKMEGDFLIDIDYDTDDTDIASPPVSPIPQKATHKTGRKKTQDLLKTIFLSSKKK